MDIDKKHKSDLENDRDQKNTETNASTGAKAADVRKDNDKPAPRGSDAAQKSDEHGGRKTTTDRTETPAQGQGKTDADDQADGARGGQRRAS